MHELIAKYLSDNASEEEKMVVEKWRGESAQNAAEFLEFKETWNLLGTSNSDLKLPVEEDTNRIVGWAPYLKYAAAIVLLTMIGTLWYFNSNDDSMPTPEVFAGKSEILEDGTIVSLKDGGELVAVEISETERVVRVRGKAFFEVTHDEKRPFHVVTENAQVKVLGTSFLVNTTDNFTEVCVESGSVNFSMNSGKNAMSLNLEKGEMGMIGKDIRGIIKRKNDNQNFLAWKDGIMTFERTDMKQVVSILRDAYDAEIQLPKNLSNCQLTAKFNKKSLEEVIQILSATFNWSHDISKDKVVLSGEGC